MEFSIKDITNSYFASISGCCDINKKNSLEENKEYNDSISEFQINIPTNGYTLIKNSINFTNTKTSIIKTKDINHSLDNEVDNKQVYTFGSTIPNRWVAVGLGNDNSMVYSNDGITWTPIPNSLSIFSDYGGGVAWNGTMWVAVGQGTNNTIAYSYDGIEWSPVLNSLNILTIGYGITWNGKRWIAVGEGTNNNIAYSSDGINWEEAVNNFFVVGIGVAWNENLGSVYIQHPTISVGGGNNTIAYSRDGIKWNGLGKSILSVTGYGVAWNGEIWIVVGEGKDNSIAYSKDGITWTPSYYSKSINSVYYIEILPIKTEPIDVFDKNYN